VEKFFDSW